MQKSLSIVLANTKRSKFYINELKKNKIYLENIIFYSKITDSKILKSLEKYPYKDNLFLIKSNNINNKTIEKELLKIKSKYILFSGYNAEILKNKKILKKNIIHCHPGLLPKYRGSTVFYYSMLEMNRIDVSVFKMTKKIDEGRILFTKGYSFPKNKIDLENDFDHIIRAKTLVSFIKSKKSKFKKLNSKFDSFYYIAHPIIRSIILNPKLISRKL
tara:strand:+ start:32 stop:679 length:648 start_codon:yes stop_codon:yes gene_type:complete